MLGDLSGRVSGRQVGDNSAVMGNVDTEHNAFSAVVRWRLGVLPSAAVFAHHKSGAAFALQALNLPPGPGLASAD